MSSNRGIFYGTCFNDRPTFQRTTQKHYVVFEHHLDVACFCAGFRHRFYERLVARVLADRPERVLPPLDGRDLCACAHCPALDRLVVFGAAHFVAAQTGGCRPHPFLCDQLLDHCPLPLAGPGAHRGKKALGPPGGQFSPQGIGTFWRHCILFAGHAV